MVPDPSPLKILQTLLPHLRVAAGYAQQIQNKIISLPAKDAGDNFLSAALTDADLSIQTMIEVALLGTFPDLAFYGEEYEQSRNTKYFTSTELGTKNDYLITLDPIDGTQYYLDGFDNYQVILSILNAEEYEAAIANNQFVEITKYQESRGFVGYADELYQNVADQNSQANPDGHQIIVDSLAELKTAVPTIEPPAAPIKEPGEIQGLVSQIEFNK